MEDKQIKAKRWIRFVVYMWLRHTDTHLSRVIRFTGCVLMGQQMKLPWPIPLCETINRQQGQHMGETPVKSHCLHLYLEVPLGTNG